MPLSDLDLSADLRVGTQTAYLRSKWADEWEQIPGLEAERLIWRTLPSLGTATLHRPFGIGQFPGQPRATYQSKLDALDSFVKVTYQPADASKSPLTWYGVIVTEERQRFDRCTDPNTGLTSLSGYQIFHCLELSFLFTKRPIDRAFIAKAEDVAEVGVAPDFNANGVGNQATESHGFSEQFAEKTGDDEAEFWSSKTVLEYLIRRFPLETGNETGPAILMELADGDLVPAWDRPEIPQEGRSVTDILASVLSMKRGLGGYLEVDESVSHDPVKLRPFTYVAQDLNLGGEEGETLAANPNQFNLLVDHRPDLGTAIKLTNSEKVVRLILQGGHRRAVCTLDPQLGVEDYVANWTADDLTKYNAGGSAAGDYSGLTTDGKRQRNDTVRSNPTLSHVFQNFKLSDDWDGKTAAGTSTDAEDRKPVLVDDEDSTKVFGNWVQGLRFLPALPLYQGVDYSEDNIALKLIPETIDRETPFMPPMFFLPHSDDPDKFYEVSGGDGFWSARLRCDSEKPEFRLDVVGAKAHKLGDGEFVPLAGIDEDDTLFSWFEGLVTVAIQECRRVTVKHPEVIPDAENVACITEKLIDLGDSYRLDWMTPETAIGINKDGELIRSDGGFFRDDRPKMKALGAQLYDFYNAPRQVLYLEKTGPTKDLWLGHYVNQLGASTDAAELIEPVQTVVTSVTVVFPQGTNGSPPGVPMQTWETDQGELDLLVVTPKRR